MASCKRWNLAQSRKYGYKNCNIKTRRHQSVYKNTSSSPIAERVGKFGGYVLDGSEYIIFIILRVPKWFWKIIYSPSTRHGIALIILNIPNFAPINRNEIFWNNICQETGWFRQKFMNLSIDFVILFAKNSIIL